MPPLFEENQQLYESELVDYIANKSPRSQKAMLISQGFNPETGDWQPSWNTANGKKPQTTFLGRSFLPQKRTAKPREIKSAPSSRNGMKMVRNVIKKS